MDSAMSERGPWNWLEAELSAHPHLRPTMRYRLVLRHALGPVQVLYTRTEADADEIRRMMEPLRWAVSIEPYHQEAVEVSA